MAIFRMRKGRPEEPLIVAVAGIGIGARVLGIVEHDWAQFLDLARKVGLTGRALALTPDAATADAMGQAAIADGVTIDTGVRSVPLPVPDESFDLAVIDERLPRAAEHALAALLPEMRRALRPGGRVLVVLNAGGGPLARLLGTTTPPDVTPVLEACQEAGFSAGRLVTAREGLAFVEAVRRGAGSSSSAGL